MKSPRFLMCPPAYFGVQYVINPWMEGQIAHTDSRVAMTQWTRLCELLGQEAEVALLPPVADLPDLVFTANAALIHRSTAVLSSFRCQERQPEAPHFGDWLEENGFDVVKLPEGVFFEGAGDALLDRGQPILWAGHGFRSDLTARPLLESAIGIEVQPLHLVDPRFYHLDTCFCPLAGGYLLYFADAFDAESNAAIEARVSADKRLAIPEKDALQFACNAVNIGQRVITNYAGPEIVAWLNARGFQVTTTAMAEFMKAGGASKCLSLRLDETMSF